MNIRILTDTTSNFTIEEAQKIGITMLPIGITFDDVTFDDQYQLSTNEFYDKLTSNEVYPKTNQVSIKLLYDEFEKSKQNNEILICLFISSKLSGTFNTACIVKEDVSYNNIHVIDTLNTTLGLRVLIEKTLDIVSKTNDIKDILFNIEETVKKVRVFAGIDTLEYLFKGGRISKTKMLLGSLLKVKALISVEGGFVETIETVRGTKKALSELSLIYNKYKNYECKFMYSMNDTNLNNFIELNGIDKNITKYNLSPAIGCHIGPNGYGFVFIED
ncbi:MAG: DegV family protein [Anaeroplasmataceae bacterium]